MKGQWRRWACLTMAAAMAAGATGCGMFKGKDKGGPENDIEFLPPGAAMPLDEFPMTDHGRRDDDQGVRVTEVQFDNVLFEFDRSHVRDSEMRKIEVVAAWLRANPRTRLVVEGHCDERGSREYNMALGEYRAQAVRANLIRLGIVPDRIQTRSYGAERPLVPEHNEAAWRLNRRAEFHVYRD